MAKCANCANEAFYTYAITTDFGIDYCSRHVPRFLHAQKLSGMMKLRGESEPVQEIIVEPVVETAEEPAVEEAVLEEVVEPAPTPAPKKKTTTKKKTA